MSESNADRAEFEKFMFGEVGHKLHSQINSAEMSANRFAWEIWQSARAPLEARIKELEDNHIAYERIIGKCTYQEVADRIRELEIALEDATPLIGENAWLKCHVKGLEQKLAAAEKDAGRYRHIWNSWKLRTALREAMGLVADVSLDDGIDTALSQQSSGEVEKPLCSLMADIARNPSTTIKVKP